MINDGFNHEDPSVLDRFNFVKSVSNNFWVGNDQEKIHNVQNQNFQEIRDFTNHFHNDFLLSRAASLSLPDARAQFMEGHNVFRPDLVGPVINLRMSGDVQKTQVLITHNLFFLCNFILHLFPHHMQCIQCHCIQHMITVIMVLIVIFHNMLHYPYFTLQILKNTLIICPTMLQHLTPPLIHWLMFVKLRHFCMNHHHIVMQVNIAKVKSHILTFHLTLIFIRQLGREGV